MQNKTKSSLKSFGETVAKALTKALHECSTDALTAILALGDPEPIPTDQPSIWFGMTFGGSLQGRAVLCVKEADVAALSLGEATATPEANTAALMKVLQTTCARIEELAAGEYGALTACVQLTDRANGITLALEVGAQGEETQATLFLHIEPQLLTELERIAGAPRADVAITRASAENLDLVLDVELNATLRFGQRQLPLREIVELSSGSVVELDRQVDEPVELVLDGRVIARGEAVIIDGNYGMRITEILHPVNA